MIQGQNDPRVVEQESRDLVDGLRDLGKDVDYLVFEDEGHDVLKLANRVRCYDAITGFSPGTSLPSVLRAVFAAVALLGAPPPADAPIPTAAPALRAAYAETTVALDTATTAGAVAGLCRTTSRFSRSTRSGLCACLQRSHARPRRPRCARRRDRSYRSVPPRQAVPAA